MIRKRRYLISAAVLAACVCLTIGVLAMLPPRPGVTRANFDRLELGMTIDDATGILGDRFAPEISMPDEIVIGPIYWWTASDGTEIVIQFENGEVRQKRFRESTETIPDKVRRWLGLAK